MPESTRYAAVAGGAYLVIPTIRGTLTPSTVRSKVEMVKAQDITQIPQPWVVKRGSMTQVTSTGHKMRIAVMGTRGLPARYSGFETFAEQFSTRMVARGHTVTVYGRCKFSEQWGAQEPYKGVLRRRTPTIYQKYLETPVHAITSFIDALFQKFDVILLCNAANSPLTPILKLKGTPLLINVDGIEKDRGKWNKIGKAWCALGERTSVLFATHVISDADVIAEYYKKTYGCDSVVLPYGVHPVVRPAGETLQKFGLQPRDYILYVSRLEPENNALGVIQAYNKLSTDKPLVIVGDAPYGHEYKAKLRAAASSKVIFTGFQFGEAYEEFQSNCYCYIQATEVGGTHPALVESMSYGNCVIANGTPENLEVIGDAALSYSKNDFDQLSQILDTVLKDPAVVQEYGRRAKDRVLATYSWDTIVQRYEDLLLETVQSRVTGAIAPQVD